MRLNASPHAVTAPARSPDDGVAIATAGRREPLAEAPDELRSVVAAVSHSLWSADVDLQGCLRYRYYSPPVATITGRPPEFFLESPQRWLSILFPDDLPRLAAARHRIGSGASASEEQEYRVVRPDGQVRWVRDSVRATPLPAGGIRLHGVVSDITERRRAKAVERATLRISQAAASETSLARLTRAVGDSVAELVPAAGVGLAMLDAATESVGFACCRQQEPASQEAYRRLAVHVLRTGAPLCGAAEAVAERIAQGSSSPVSPLPAGSGWIGVPLRAAGEVFGALVAGAAAAAHFGAAEAEVLEILCGQIAAAIRQAQIQAALRDSRQALSDVIASAGEGILILDRELRYRVFNPFLERLTGKSAAEILGRDAAAPFPHHGPGIVASARRALAGETLELAEWHFRLPETGRSGWVETLLAPQRDGDGEIVGVVGLVRDVTRRRGAEQALRESEEKYRLFFAHDLAANYVSTPGGRLLACNSAFARLHGFATIDEALAADLIEVYPSPAARDAFVEALRQRRQLERHEGVIRRRDGALLHVVENAVGRFDRHGEMVEIHGFMLDVTERLRVEEQLRQAHKMEAVGQLAGGVAHEFNNLLTSILGYCELILEATLAPDPRRGALQEVQRAGERAAGLVRQLLAFSRRQVLHPAPVDLSAVVGGLDEMLRRLLGDAIELAVEAEPQLGYILADRAQIEQIVVSLAANARDAMQLGGRLLIETAAVGEDAAAAVGLDSAGWVRLTVSDTGIGIDDEAQRHLFEPFFTTKEVGRGTGLALSVIYGVVTQSGGHIRVASQPGSGARFDLYFPRHAEGAPAPRDEPER